MSLRPVRLLPSEVVHRIAAGEVVDRPASALKELLDNALDAGARSVRVLLVEAGLGRIEVEDDGQGLSREDLEVCAQRHATSKISSLEDLEAVLSLGFRGEALSAIASVSRLRIESYREGSGAWALEIKGGGRQQITPSSRARGTKVVVEDLFFNVPARRKFLKSPGAELAESQETLINVALSHPGVAFEWHLLDSQGELKRQRQLPAATLAERFAQLSPEEGELLHFTQQPSVPGIRQIEAVVYRPPVSSRFQKSLRLSVNGRPVQDKRLPYALREAFAGLIEVGQYPVGLIRIDVDPSLIDVNIHPQKKEVRWPNDVSLASLVYSVLRPRFEVAPKPLAPVAIQESLTWDLAPIGTRVEPIAEAREPRYAPESSDVGLPTTSPSWSPAAWVPALSAPRAPALTAERGPRFRFSALRVVGEVGAAWILCESPEGLILIDQHAAHERVSYERVLRSKELLRPKLLLMPVQWKIPLELKGREAELRVLLESLGFEVSDESPEGMLELLAVPESERKIDWSEVLETLSSNLIHEGEIQGFAEALKARIAASVACHGSVRRGQRLGHEQISALLQSLDEVQWGGLCPHGRPVWFLLSHEQIETLFHR